MKKLLAWFMIFATLTSLFASCAKKEVSQIPITFENYKNVTTE